MTFTLIAPTVLVLFGLASLRWGAESRPDFIERPSADERART